MLASYTWIANLIDNCEGNIKKWFNSKTLGKYKASQNQVEFDIETANAFIDYLQNVHLVEYMKTNRVSHKYCTSIRKLKGWIAEQEKAVLQ